MGLLPGHANAIIPEAKLRYCLDSSHPDGQHKARVFASALGLGLGDTGVLRRMLLEGITRHGATHRFTRADGTQRWVVEWIVAGRLGPLRPITAWDYSSRFDRLALISCYLKKGGRREAGHC